MMMMTYRERIQPLGTTNVAGEADIASYMSASVTLQCTRNHYFSIAHFMRGRGKVLTRVKRCPTTPLPGLCTPEEILLFMTALSLGKSRDLGVVSLDSYGPTR